MCYPKYLISILSISMLWIASIATADEKSEAALKGFDIAKERKHRDLGWESSQSTITMVLKNKQGESSIRKIRMKNLEMENDGDRSLTIFDEPRDTKGTTFLVHSHPTKADDQWLYLPSLKRVKRISSKNKSGPFMGSEFAYEDLSSFELEKYTYSYLRDETLKGQNTHVITQIPTDKYSGYTRQIIWIDTEHFRPLKTEYYDRKDSLLKTLYFEEYQHYQDKYWRAHKMSIENHQTGNATELLTHDMEFKIGLSKSDFSTNTLKRVR